MNTTRRKFIKQTSVLTGSMLFAGKLFAQPYASDHIVGIQLYSVRDDMQKDAAGTLKQLSAIGYRYVEHANYKDRKFYGYSPEEFKKLLAGLNMTMPSGHTQFKKEHWDESKKDFTDEWKYTVEDAAAVGQKYVISPWMDEKIRKDMELLKQFMDLFNRCGELCKKHNMKFGYHNHNFEFDTNIGGERLYDYILKNTDPALVAQQMDIGNMYGAGGRALDILKQYPGRFELMHVKDEIESGKGEMNDKYESTILGKGIIGVKGVIDYARKSGGTTQFIIEQESYQGKTPVDCVREDFEIMKNWGY